MPVVLLLLKVLHRVEVMETLLSRRNSLGVSLFYNNRGGVLDDVLGLEDIFEDTFASLWPWH